MQNPRPLRYLLSDHEWCPNVKYIFIHKCASDEAVLPILSFRFSLMRWLFLSVALSIKAAISFPDSDELPGTNLSYNIPDLQIPTIDTGLLKIYRPGSDVPVTFLDAISTDIEVVPAEIASGGNSCLSRRYDTEKKGQMARRSSCPAPSPAVKEPATQEPPTGGRGHPRPVHTPEVLDPDIPDPVTKPARKPQEKRPGPVPLHPPINRIYDNPFIADINGRIKICASRLMTLCCWGPIIKPMTTQTDNDNCQRCAYAHSFQSVFFPPQIEDFFPNLPPPAPWARNTKICSWDKRGLTSFPVSFDFIFSDGVCEDPGRYVCCHNIDVRLHKDFNLSSFTTSEVFHSQWPSPSPLQD